MQSYTLDQYIADIRQIASDESDNSKITDKIKPLAEKITAERGWFKAQYREVDDEQGFGLHLLFEEENHDLAVFVIAWAPGKGLAAHNHKTWAVVSGIEGQEHEVNYTRRDDGSKPGFADLAVTREETLYPGKAVCCMPEDIHSVWNNGQQVAVSLHTYGRHLNHTGRSVFDVDAKTESPCVVKVKD
ncbi:hypothetical protein AB833_01875 [Chromatiales bacterium (ex Bugula neritina AB1)]|nr:hypothetical protein AB833_01875 [Chromatiales bacterium (ex Bugula neritina AB1)]